MVLYSMVNRWRATSLVNACSRPVRESGGATDSPAYLFGRAKSRGNPRKSVDHLNSQAI